jgi:hypothetical protein
MKLSGPVVALSVAFLLAGGVTFGAVRSVAVDPNSELGQEMQKMDRSARAFQNRARFTRELREFEAKAGDPCLKIEFKELEEPALSVSGRVAVYIMHGTCGAHGERSYRVKVKFSDDAMTVARSVKVLERIESKVKNKQEPNHSAQPTSPKGG